MVLYEVIISFGICASGETGGVCNEVGGKDVRRLQVIEVNVRGFLVLSEI